MSRLVKSKELSLIISIPVYSIRKLTREGKIPAYHIDGKSYLYDPDEVISVVKNSLKIPLKKVRLSSTVTDTHRR
jgi:hypothetical protein